MRSHSRIADDIDITSMWDVLKHSAPKLVATACAVGLVTYAAASLVTPKYTSETQILIGGQGLNERLRDPQLGSGSQSDSLTKVDKEAVASQVIALRSRDLAVKLATQLELSGRAEFNSAVREPSLPGSALRMFGLGGPRTGQSEEERVLEAYYDALRVYQGRDTRVISIEFTSADSQLAATAANRLAELYQDWLRSRGVSQTTDASEWLRPQIDKLAKEVAEAEAEAERFRSEANLFRGSAPSAGLNEQQLTELSSELTKARTARGEAEARARSARDLLQRGNAEAILDVQKSPVIQALIAQRVRAEREKAEAEAVLLPAHPRMKQLSANVADVRRQIAREAATIVEGLDKEAKVVALREELARKTLDEMKSRVGDTAPDIARLASLEGQAKAKRRELETLQASYEAARSRGDAKAIPLEAQIISRARSSGVPSSPKKLQLAGLAAAVALVLGLVTVLTRELLASGSESGSPKAEVHSLPVARNQKLRAVAPASGDGMGAKRPLGRATAPAEFASVEALAVHLQRMPARQGARRFLVAGREAKTDARAEAAKLARSLAKAGLEVVLLDWSRDGKRVQGFPVPEPAPGVMDLLYGGASFEEAIRPLPDSDAHYIGYGNAPEGHVRLEAEQINLVLDALEETYDQIVVTGVHSELADLVRTIDGRFDVNVVVTGNTDTDAGNSEQPGHGAFGLETNGMQVLVLRSDVPGSRVATSAGAEALA